MSGRGSSVCQPKTRYSTVSPQEAETKEGGVAFPEYNHLSVLNLLLVLPWQVKVLVKPDEGILAFFQRQENSKRHLAAA